MAYEDYLASPSWLNLPPVRQPTGLLATEPTMTPYQRAMAQMQQPTTPVAYQGLLGVGSSGGYKPGIFKQRTPEELLKGLQSITDYRGGGTRSEAEQARINAFFDAMTPAELAAFQQKNADFINMLLGPKLLTVVKDFIQEKLSPVQMTPATYTPPAQIVNAMGGMGGYNPSLFSPVVTPVVTVGEGQAVSDGEGITAPSLTITPVSSIGGGTVSSGGISPSSGSPMGGIASTGTSGQAAAAVGAANAAAASGIGSGGVSASSGSPMGGIAANGGSAASGGGGGGGGGGGCCFIMLEARYGDGTMDAVVRRYRDEKITDRNKRGYYKLAEVFVPLMRASKFFKFMVAKTFADPLVSYGKWHYGQNRHGWIFKPVERFWMKVFNILGTDTKFIRENGETV